MAAVGAIVGMTANWNAHMAYQLELQINLPRTRVVELFLDPENVAKWQTSLVSMEQIEGIGRELGAKTRQLHRMGNREQWMTETITVFEAPDRFSAVYEGGGVHNLIENRFYEAGNNKTRWVVVSDFSGSNLMMRLMVRFLPGMFKKQTFAFMEMFKAFAEGNADG